MASWTDEVEAPEVHKNEACSKVVEITIVEDTEHTEEDPCLLRM